jgi:hypothetical protein
MLVIKINLGSREDICCPTLPPLPAVKNSKIFSTTINLESEGLFQKLSTALVKARWKFSDDALLVRDMSTNL